MLERDYQAHVIKELYNRFPGCIVLKNDAGYLQGIPDITIFFKRHWAVLEVKRSKSERTEPNQLWYICKMNDMSFAAFIYPENEEEVLNALQQALRPRRASRVS